MNNVKTRFHEGTKVRHFKHCRLSSDEKAQHLYEYEIVAHGNDTETGKPYVVYRSLADSSQVWVRPEESFYSEIDKNKYPYALQDHRFEAIEDQHSHLQQIQ